MNNKITGDAVDRFESKIDKTNDCWLWTAGGQPIGYGIFWANGRNNYAHHVSYRIYKGEIPKGIWVLHTCDNKACVNPDHLYLGTHSDNTKDAVERKRMASGDRHGSKTKPFDRSFTNTATAKLSKDDCVEILTSFKSGTSYADIMKRYSIHSATVYRAKRRAALINELNK